MGYALYQMAMLPMTLGDL